MTDDEKDRALCEAHCNSAADEYFNARPQLDSGVNRRIFYAGHRKAWIERSEAVRLNAQAVPDGWKLVPVAALKRWRDAFADKSSTLDINHRVQTNHYEIVALLSAAPAAPQPAQASGYGPKLMMQASGFDTQTPQPAQPLDLSVMELAESVGLIGPASRTDDLHEAIQRFHDLIVANASIKAALHFADGLAQQPTGEKDALLRQALEALEGFANITNDSQGVAGYHLSGDTAEWDEFDEVDAASSTIEAIRNHLGVKND